MITEKQRHWHNASKEILGDWVQLHDPFTGEPLSGDRPPTSILYDAKLQNGFDYLRQNPDIHITIFGENHSDGSYTNPEEAQRYINGADAVFLELIGHNQEIEQLYFEVAQGRGIDVSQQTVGMLGPYKLRQLKLLAGIGKPVFYPEISSEGSQYEKDLMEFTKILESLVPLALNDQNMLFAAEVNLAASTLLRDWFMIGKMGQQMSGYESVTGEKIRSAMLWIGAEHINTISGKLHATGVQVTGVEAKKQVVTDPPRELRFEGRRTNHEVPFAEAARDGLARMIKHS